MSGSLAGSATVTTSFTVTITRTTLSPSTALDQTRIIGPSPSGPTSYTVPTFTTSPTGQESSVVYTDETIGIPAGVMLTGTTYDWSPLSA